VIPDDPIDDLCESVGDGAPVDWDLTESTVANLEEQSKVRAMRDIDRIARYNRTLQRPPGTTAPSSGTAAPAPWGHLMPLELVSWGRSGEVWRSWDAWLQREVALKFLLAPDAGSLDGSALLAEARALARVRHPGVVNVHGIGSHDGRVGMWMEFLAGPTLDAEIQRRGPLPIRDTARIGLEICEALQAVVAAGLVHRDIKPANIVLESSGRTVLTDFGLGRRMALAERAVWHASGTPLFMAPELLAGGAATPRSDIYALGVTLRWALTGRNPFRARTLEELKAEAEAGPSVPLRSERPDAPPTLVEAVERAMRPDPAARWDSAAQLAESLRHVVHAPPRVGTTLWKWGAAAASALLLGAVLYQARLAPRPVQSPAGRFTISGPPGHRLVPNTYSTAVSPDGRLMVFTAEDSTGVTRLWLRPLGALQSTPLEGTEHGELPFWSPDSRYLGFFADLKLKKLAIAGGRPEILCNAPDPRGASWGRGGVIVFAPLAAGPIYRVSAEGGFVTEVMAPDSTRRETALRWPHFLPDGERFMFVALPPKDGTFDVYVGTPGSGERRLVMKAGSAPIPAGDKGLVLANNGRLFFQRFDYRRLKPVGAPVALGVATGSDASVGQPLATASRNGVLARPDEALPNTRLVWVDRSGNRLGALPLPAGRYEKHYFSPDGTRLLVERRDSPTTVDLWMVDLPDGTARRFTQGSQSRIGGRPSWSPDGRRIAFSSNREGRTNIYQRGADEAAEEHLLFESDGQFKEVFSWSPDGRYLIFGQAAPRTGWDLWLLPVGSSPQAPIPYLHSVANEVSGRISPDGRWMVYSSDASGRVELYVRSFPAPGVEQLVSHELGDGTWRRDGRELLIPRTREKQIWSIPVEIGPTFRAGAPRMLFREHPGALWVDVHPDGHRFLESIPVDGEPPTIVVDLNFLSRIGL
jgi:serine/threonine protein kinase/Tol biopolymer transport system component